jgi:hypothetical protein
MQAAINARVRDQRIEIVAGLERMHCCCQGSDPGVLVIVIFPVESRGIAWREGPTPAASRMLGRDSTKQSRIPQVKTYAGR